MLKYSPFKQGFLSGLAGLAVVGFVLAGWALLDREGLARTFAAWKTRVGRADSPAVIDSPQAFSRVGTILQVFQTNSTYDGAGPAGYGRSGMHDACRLADPASHFCTIQEVENAWKTSGVNLLSISQVWIDNAIVGTGSSDFGGDVSAASDWFGGAVVGDYPYNCNAWTYNNNLGRGLILNSGTISPATEACDDFHPVACCKYKFEQSIYLPLLLK